MIDAPRNVADFMKNILGGGTEPDYVWPRFNLIMREASRVYGWKYKPKCGYLPKAGHQEKAEYVADLINSPLVECEIEIGFKGDAIWRPYDSICIMSFLGVPILTAKGLRISLSQFASSEEEVPIYKSRDLGFGMGPNANLFLNIPRAILELFELGDIYKMPELMLARIGSELNESEVRFIGSYD